MINKIKYRQYDNGLKSSIRRDEQNHYFNEFQQKANDIRATWKIINTLLDKNNNSLTINEFLVENKMVSDPKIIADGFNSYFTNIGPSLAKKIPCANKQFDDYFKFSNLNSLDFYLTNYQEIDSLMKN